MIQHHQQAVVISLGQVDNGSTGGAGVFAREILFFALMRDHHLGGMAMAEHAAATASDPWVRELAARMARNQRAEIAEMDGVRDRGRGGAGVRRGATSPARAAT